MKQWRKNVKHKEKTRNDITKKTKKPLKKKECKDIGNQKKWTKKCNNCGNLQFYGRKDVRDRAVRLNIGCNSCKEFSEEHRKRIGIKSASRKYNTDVVQQRLSTLYERYPDGYKHTDDVKKNISKRMKEDNPMFNEEIKNRVRTSLFQKYNGWFPTNKGVAYNKDACKLFDEINNKLGWNGLHAENGGEIAVAGFYLDYYEPNKNIVIEFDEQYHKKPSRAQRDALKDKVLTKELNCVIIRITKDYDINQLIKQLSSYE